MRRAEAVAPPTTTDLHDRLDGISGDLSILRTLVDSAINEMAPDVGESINLLFAALIVLGRADDRFQALDREVRPGAMPVISLGSLGQ